MSRNSAPAYRASANCDCAASRMAARIAAASRRRGGARSSIAASLMSAFYAEWAWASGPRGNDHLHALEAVHEGRVAAHRLANHLDHREALQDLFPDDGELHLGHAIADAAVDAEAERHVLARTLAVDDVGVGIVDHLFVAIAQDVPHHHPLAGLDRLSAPPAILCRHPRPACQA